MEFKIDQKSFFDTAFKLVLTAAISFICWIGQSALQKSREINDNISDIKTQIIILNFKYDKLEKRVEKVEGKIDKVYYFNNKRDE